MSIKSNTPALSYVSWQNCYITYDNINYVILDSYTCKKYVYWNSSIPNQFETSDRLLDESGSRHLVIINDKGIYSVPSLKNIQMNFTETGGNESLIANQILGFHETNEQNGQKIATMEKSVDGMEANVLEIKRENEKLTQDITSVKATTNEFSAKVTGLEKEFNDDKNSQELRDNINSAIISFNSTLGSFSTDMGSYMKDNVITENENASINIYTTTLELDRTNVNTQIDLVLNALQQNGETNNYNNLKSQKDSFNNYVDSLLTIINSAKTDNNITTTEINNITTAFGNVNTNILLLKNTIDDIVFLGVGGKLLEQIAQMSVKSNNILLSVSQVEQTLKNSLNIKKSSLQTQITDLYTSIDKVKQTSDSAISDRNITDLEKGYVREAINLSNSEFKNVEDKYQEIVNDICMSEATKINIKNSYENVLSHKNNMANRLTEIYSDGLIDDAEISEINQIISNYKNALNIFHQDLSFGLDEIQVNDWNKKLIDLKGNFSNEINDLKEELNKLTVDFDSSVISGLVDEVEKENMLSDLSSLKREKNIIDNKFNKWYSDPFLLGNDKSLFKSIYDDFVKKYSALIDLINSIANSNRLVSESDRENVENAKTLLNESLANFYSECDRVIGVISKNETDYLNNTFKQELKDVNSAINTLESTLNDTFKDSIITETEMAKINSILIQIEKEKEDVDKKYNEIYGNTNLK